MRLFFIGTVPINGTGVSPDSMEAHVFQALKKLSIECEYFPFLTRPLGQRLNRVFEIARTDLNWIPSTPADKLLVSAARKYQPDLILVLLGNYTSPATIQMVREATGAPIACWCQDNMGTMGRQYIIGSGYDYVFAKDQTMVDLFRRYTSLPEVHYLAEACNPEIHHSVTLSTAETERFGCEVTTAASLYYFRAEILKAVSEFNLKLWGTLPRYYSGLLRKNHAKQAIFMRDKAACFNAAKIVINSLHPMEFGGLNARAFEVAGCGGFQLITHSDAVRRHFIPGQEIETFKDLHELRDKVRYYLAHDEERHSIAEAGRKRAHSEHTYVKRLEQMLAIIFKLNPKPQETTS